MKKQRGYFSPTFEAENSKRSKYGILFDAWGWESEIIQWSLQKAFGNLYQVYAYVWLNDDERVFGKCWSWDEITRWKECGANFFFGTQSVGLAKRLKNSA